MMKWIVIVAVAVVAALADDDCSPPPMGQKKAHPGECCAMGDSFGKFKEAAMKCMEKYPKPERPSGPRPTGTPPPPTAEMKNRHACMEECVYTEAGAVTSDKQLDKPAITKMLADSGSAAPAAIEKCYASYKSEIDQTLECKSGAFEFNKCLKREMFLNCPSANWTSSADCEELKTRVKNCPMMPIHLGGGHMHKH